MMRRFLCIPATAVLVLMTGCPESAPPPTSPEATEQSVPAASAETPAAEADDAEAVAAIDELDVKLKRNGAGNVTEFNANESQAEIGDDVIEKLKGLPALENVNLDYTQVSNDGLAALADIEGLKAVSLRRCPNIDDAGLEHLTKLPKLERLSLLYNSNSVTDAGMKSVGKIKTLRLLDLRGCTQISDEGLAHLAGLTNLVDFKIQTGAVGDDGLAHLADMKKLRSLALEKTRITNDGLAALEGMTDMQGLNLYLTPIDDEGFVHFKNMTKLKDVNVRDTATQGTGLVHLHPSRDTLTKLNLSETFLTDEGMANLAPLTNLEWLDLWYSGVTDAGMPHLSDLSKIKYLRLEQCDISDMALAEIAKLTSLTELNLSTTNVTDEGLTTLESLTNLKKLDLGNTQVSDDAVEAFQQAVPDCVVKR